MNRYATYSPTDSPTLEEGDAFFVGVNSYDSKENVQVGQVQAATNIDFSKNNAATRGGFVCIPELGNAPFDASSLWTSRTSAADKNWFSVAYGNGRYVAVANNGGTSDVMTSTDGVNWSSTTSGVANQWTAITYGNGLFVAVAYSGTGNRVMTSPDGLTWTARTSAADILWQGVVWGGSTYVAVASDGGTQQVMTSPDGITWTRQTTPSSQSGINWSSVAYGNGTFVAVAGSGTGNRVMTSSDGITWTARTSAADNQWEAVVFGGGKFVAVSATGSTSSAMTSTDGITWTLRTTPGSGWLGLCYGNGLFVAVSNTGVAATAVMTSPDGITWTARTGASGNTWYSVANGNNLFVAVSNNGTGDRVMTAGATSSVFASGIYSDPNDAGSQWVMLVGYNRVGFYAFGKQSRTVNITTETVSEQSTVVQCNNQVYIFRGSSSTPLYWTGDWSTNFVVAPTPTPATGFQIVPNSNQATFYQNRLWVIDGKDEIAASDVLDFTTYDLLTNNFNLNTGSSDYLVTTYPFGDNALIVFKNKSILVLQNVQGSLADVTVTEVTRQVGAIGINSVVSVGSDLVYVSDRNVNLVSLTSTNNALQHKTQPLSRNIQSIIARVNWQVASKISMAYWDNKLFIALTLDNATVCSSVVVYNFVTEQWFGEWSFDSSLGMAIQGWVVATYLGATRLHCITEDGRIYVTNEGQNDISGTTVAEISTSLTTRAYRLDNNNHIPRRMWMDLSTNRPNFAVVAYADGASESSTELSSQTYSRSDSWLWNDSAYDLTNANDDYNRAYRQDYSTGPNSVQCGTGFQPEMLQDYRLPLITRRSGRLSWFKLTNTTGVIVANGLGVETRAGMRSSLIQV